MRAAILALCACALLAAAPEDIANDISERVMSPYCPGVTLHDCPSAESIAMRAEITEWARSGMSAEEIEARLIDEYGPQIMATPPTSGFNLLAWILPALATVTGLVVAVVVARRWSTRRSDATVVASPEEIDRLNAELRAYRGGP